MIKLLAGVSLGGVLFFTFWLAGTFTAGGLVQDAIGSMLPDPTVKLAIGIFLAIVIAIGLVVTKGRLPI